MSARRFERLAVFVFSWIILVILGGNEEKIWNIIYMY